MINYGQRIDIKLPGGHVPECARDAIFDFLRDNSLPSVPGWFDWRLKVGGKGEYVGSFAKRYAKYAWQAHNCKVPADLLGKLGSLVGERASRATRYSIDFTRDFNWRAGDFGDGGSCYWGCRAAARTALAQAGAFAIRTWDESTGSGRAWIVREGDFFVVFNGYGPETSQFALILAHHLGLSYRKVSLTNNGEDGGLIWINGATGYVVGAEDRINGMSQWDLSIDCEFDLCAYCNSPTNGNPIVTVGGDHICEHCYCDEYFTCSHCGEIHRFDDCTSIGDNCVCEDCLRTHYTLCGGCDEYWSDSEVTATRDGDRCPGCMDYYVECAGCGDYVHCNDVVDDSDGDPVCPDCLKRYYDECAGCGDYRLKRGCRITEDGPMCPDCMDDYVECECGDIIHNSNSFVHNGAVYCRACGADYLVCGECGADLQAADRLPSGRCQGCADYAPLFA